jgi:polysaccharide deacetylase family protein (PEP-CTERM system associated)
MLNALTIDVEDYFQVHAFQSVITRANWDRYATRVVDNTERILKLLAEHDVRATFFVLGWVAERYPALVRAIAEQGHEIGTHGYWHELVYQQTPTVFASDLQRSLTAITDAVPDANILGYRAPAFSITAASLWALDVLADHGIQYDSSIFPLSLHDRYGIADANRFASRLSNGMWEFPTSTVKLGKWNWPVAGGGYFRLYPRWLTERAIHHLNQQGEPAVIYLHPWEFDPTQPRVNDAPRLSKFRHYVNLAKTEARLRYLIKQYHFGPMAEVFANQLGQRDSMVTVTAQDRQAKTKMPTNKRKSIDYATP